MSFIGPASGKKTLIMAVLAASAAVIVLIVFFPSSGVKKTEVNEDVVSKRARFEPRAPEQAMPSALPQPGAVTTLPVAAETKHVAAEPEAQKTKEPSRGAVSDKGVKQAPSTPGEKEIKPRKTVKAEKTVPENGKTKAKNKTSPHRSAAVKSKPWAVNIASFPDEGPAKQLAASLRSAGYNAYVTGTAKNGRTWHRVRAGFYRTREEAEKAGKAMESKFNVSSTWVVKPARNEAAAHIGQ
ncbi:MAG: SPOR domain-containing protein [Deltaproteobacteria bacterium]